jgi:cytochrome P450
MTLPGIGVHLPAGTSIGFPQCAIHRDQASYYDPLKYHAYRHVPEEWLEKNKYIHGDAPEELCRKGSMATTSVNYLVFGHGRHVCPGRYVFSYLAKLLLSEIILRYDIESVGSRPHIKRKFPFFTSSISFSLR